MREHVKDKWVAALRDGGFEQTDGILQDGTGYCCLGVLCVLAEEDGVYVEKAGGRISGGALSEQLDVRVWSGAFYVGKLVEMNDKLNAYEEHEAMSHTHNFKAIADHIDKHWEKM